MTARVLLRMVCSIMLLTVTKALRGKASTCQRKAAAPTAMTAGSWRKRRTTSGAHSRPATAHTRRKAVPTLTQNHSPSSTRP